MTSPAAAPNPSVVNALARHQQQYISDAKDVLEQVTQLERNMGVFFDKLDAAFQSPYPHSKAYDDMSELLVQCSKLVEKTEKSHIQHLAIPQRAKDTPELAVDSIEAMIASGRADVSTLHKDNLKFARAFDEVVLRRLK